LQPLCCPAPSCSKTFTTTHKLQRHLRVHMGTPTRRCKFANCSKTFSSTGNLNRHMRNQHIRFGHPLANEAKTQQDQSPTSVDSDPASLFAWGDDEAVQAMATPIGEDAELDASSEHKVSDEELLEVLSCFLDDEPTSSTKAGQDAPAETKDATTVEL
jgi:hypothetical protein